MRKYLNHHALVYATTFFVMMPCAYAANITDTGPGSFADINNTSTLDYVLLNNSGSITNITNASNGTLNGSAATTINSTSFGQSLFALGVDGATVTGSISNDGQISQTDVATTTVSILAANGASVGGNITNAGHIMVTTTLSRSLIAGILTDAAVTVSGNIINVGTIDVDEASGGNNYGIFNVGSITGSVTNSGTINTISGVGIYNAGTIIDGITNSGTITATNAIVNNGTALTITQTAGQITGSIGLSGNGDTLNISGGTVVGDVFGSGADQVNFTGGTLVLTGANGINGVNSYTQGTNGNLIAQVSTAGMATIAANDINLDGTLVISPQGGGFLTAHTYTDVIDAGTTLSGSFTSVTSDSNQYNVSLIANGGNAYDLTVTWMGGVGAHTIDMGPGTFVDISNAVTTNYIALSNGATISNLTNAGSGVINGTAVPFVQTTCCGVYAASLSVDASTVTGNITNNGTISQLSAVNNVAGIAVANASNIGGDVTNNGQIMVATSGNNNTAAGIFIDTPVTVTGDLTNAGSITSTATDRATAEAIFNQGTISGNLINNGQITATGGEVAYGVYDGGTISGSLINNGVITVSASGAFPYGIAAFGTIGDSFINNGTITVTGGTGSITEAIVLNDRLPGNFTNTGTITAVAGAHGNSFNIQIFNTIAGNFTNTGKIITVTGDDGDAYGIQQDDPILGSFINVGTISATTGTDGDAQTLYIDTISGNFINSSTISATSGEADGSAETLDIGTVSGNFINTGTISATSGVQGYSETLEIGNILGNLTNSGTISATTGAQGSSYAFQNQSISGNLINSGTISAVAGTGGTAYGIYNNGGGAITGGIINTGTIEALAPGGTAWSIYSNGDAQTINQNGGWIIGNVGLSGLGDVFNINGGTVMGGITGNVGTSNSNTADSVNVSGGTLLVPAGQSVSDIGPYTQGSGGTLALGVTPSTAGSVSADTISLAGTFKVAVSGGGWVLGTPVTYTDVINAGTSLSGSFGTVSTPALFTASLVPDGSKALSLSVTEIPADTGQPAVDSLISSLLGNSSPNTTQQSLTNALEGLTAPQLQNAVTQLTAPTLAQSVMAIRDVSSGLADTVQQRLLIGSSYDTSNLMSLSMVNNQLQMASLTDMPIFGSPLGDNDTGIWMRGFGSFAGGAAQGGIAGFNQDRSGAVAGIDQKLGDNWTIGLAAQYARTNLNFTDGSASSTARSYDGILYGGWHDYDLYVNGTAGFGWNVYSSGRSLNIGGFTANPTGSFSGQDYSASAEAGYAFHTQAWEHDMTLIPYAGLGYTYTQTSGFTESGDGVTNLIVQPGHSNSLTTSLGVRASTKIETKNNGIFVPEVHMAWAHENLDKNQNINAAFVSSPGSIFSTNSANYGRDSAILGLAVTQQLSTHSRVFLTYDAHIQPGFTEHAISGGIRFEF